MNQKYENTPVLYTERLILRRFTQEDAKALFDILSDKDVNAFLPMFPLESLQEAEQYLRETYLKSYNKPVGYRYAICLKSDNIPIGYVGLSDNESHDFGYGLMKRYWNKGIVTEAAKAVLDRIRLSGMDYVTATHDVKNPASGEVMKKIGMTYQYSYEEQWQPKDVLVTFRMYQKNFDEQNQWVYNGYKNSYPHFVEEF